MHNLRKFVIQLWSPPQKFQKIIQNGEQGLPSHWFWTLSSTNWSQWVVKIWAGQIAKPSWQARPTMGNGHGWVKKEAWLMASGGHNTSGTDSSREQRDRCLVAAKPHLGSKQARQPLTCDKCPNEAALPTVHSVHSVHSPSSHSFSEMSLTDSLDESTQFFSL